MTSNIQDHITAFLWKCKAKKYIVHAQKIFQTDNNMEFGEIWKLRLNYKYPPAMQIPLVVLPCSKNGWMSGWIIFDWSFLKLSLAKKQKENQEWTIERHWQHYYSIHKTQEEDKLNWQSQLYSWPEQSSIKISHIGKNWMIPSKGHIAIDGCINYQM